MNNYLSVLLAAAALCVSTGAQSTEILSTVGATCTLEREGKLLATLVIPSTDGKLSLSDQYVIPLTSYAPVTITCSAPGYRTAKIVGNYGPVEYTVSTPLCEAPPHPTAAEKKAADDCARHNPGGYGFKVNEYPEIVRLPLEPDSAH